MMKGGPAIPVRLLIPDHPRRTAMTDHPLLGAALFVIGAVLVGDAYYRADGQAPTR